MISEDMASSHWLKITLLLALTNTYAKNSKISYLHLFQNVGAKVFVYFFFSQENKYF